MTTHDNPIRSEPAAQLPTDLQRSLALAIRAGDLAGLPAHQVRCGAYIAVTEVLLDRAEQIGLAAPYADRLEDVRRDEAEAQRLRQLALDFQAKAGKTP